MRIDVWTLDIDINQHAFRWSIYCILRILKSGQRLDWRCLWLALESFIGDTDLRHSRGEPQTLDGLGGSQFRLVCDFTFLDLSSCGWRNGLRGVWLGTEVQPISDSSSLSRKLRYRLAVSPVSEWGRLTSMGRADTSGASRRCRSLTSGLWSHLPHRSGHSGAMGGLHPGYHTSPEQNGSRTAGTPKV